jgi:hypothetical protein
MALSGHRPTLRLSVRCPRQADHTRRASAAGRLGAARTFGRGGAGHEIAAGKRLPELNGVDARPKEFLAAQTPGADPFAPGAPRERSLAAPPSSFWANAHRLEVPRGASPRHGASATKQSSFRWLQEKLDCFAALAMTRRSCKDEPQLRAVEKRVRTRVILRRSAGGEIHAERGGKALVRNDGQVPARCR